MNRKTALVTDLKVIDSPQAGIGVARCLRTAGINVIGIDNTPLFTSSPNLFKKAFCWEELATLNFDSLIKKIIDIKKFYSLQYIFPCYDETAILFSFIKDKLDFLNIKLISPPIETIKKIRKANLSNIIKRGDKYTVPRAKVINKIKQGAQFAQSIGYPVICKGLTKGAFTSKNEDDLKLNIKKVANIWNNGKVSCLIEEFIEGKYINCVAGIKDNKIISYVEMEKIGLDQNGATWFGKVKKTRFLFSLAKYLVKTVKFNDAVIEIETVFREGKYYIYEINPRTPAWIYAACILGLNIPESVVSLNNKKIKYISREGFFGRETKHFIREDIDNYKTKMEFYAKGAAYKNENLKYPSEILLRNH